MSGPQGSQRRDFVRVLAEVPVTIRRELDPARRLDAFTTDVSGCGMGLAGPIDIAVGELFEFELRLPDDSEPIAGRARVVRECGGGGRGCRIERIESSGRERLVRFTFDRQRDRLAQGVRR